MTGVVGSCNHIPTRQMNLQRGWLGLRAGPVPEGLACIGWPGPTQTQGSASLPGHGADGGREAGGGFPQLPPDFGDCGRQAGGGECPLDPGRTGVFCCPQPWPLRGRPLSSWLYKNLLCVRPCVLDAFHNNPVRRDLCLHFTDEETEARGAKWSAGGHTAFMTEMGFVTLAPTFSDPRGPSLEPRVSVKGTSRRPLQRQPTLRSDETSGPSC